MSSTRTSRRGRRLGLFILAALITLVLLYSAYWLLFGVYLRAQTETWIDSRRNAGYVIDYDDLDVGGYPTTVRLSFTRPAMTAPPHDGGWSWSAAGLDISTSPFIWTRSTIEVLGDHTMEFTTTIGRVAARGRADAFMIETDAGGPLPAGDLHIRDWTLQTANGESMTLAALDASGRNISDASDDAYPDATYALTASAATLKLPAQYDLPLGNEIQAVAFNSLLIGHLDPRRWPEGLMRWRDNGGIWEIMRLAATHGPLSFAGSGTVALDAAAQPAGAFTFEVQGLMESVQAFEARGMLKQKEAFAAKLLWSALSRPSADGGKPVVRVPMTVQDRILAVGPLRLFEVPAVHWR